MQNLRHLLTLIRARYISGYTVAFILVVPGFIWIALDRGIWRGDPCGYAQFSIQLYQRLITDGSLWVSTMLYGQKAPLIAWVGQFFVGIGYLIGSINFSLLLIPLIATYVTLVLSFRSFEILFKSRVIAFCGCLIVASSPLFNGLSTQFWIEPMQVAITSWFIYLMIKAGSWNFYFALSQFIAAFSLAMLIKFSSPLYILGPAVAFWILLFRSNPSMSIDKKDFFFLAGSLFIFFSAAVFYFFSLRDVLAFVRHATTSPIYGSEPTPSRRIAFWIGFLNNGIFLPYTLLLAAVLLFLGVVKTIKDWTLRKFNLIFFIALFQIAAFFVVWLLSRNEDPRYFLPTLPYFVILVCWGLATVNSRILTGISASIFFIQFILVSGFAFRLVELTPAYGSIRPLSTETKTSEKCIIQDVMRLVTRDSSAVFDLKPDFDAGQVQYELSKQNVIRNWFNWCRDITGFYNLREIEAGKISVDGIWKKILVYNPDFYITLKSRLASNLSDADLQNEYQNTLAAVHSAIAFKMKNCALYETVFLQSHPELLVFRKCGVETDVFCGNEFIRANTSKP